MNVFLGEGTGRASYLFASLLDGERRVLRPLSGGASNKEIARQLGLSESTVKSHVAAMMRGGRFENRVQLARWALLHPNVFREGYVVRIDLHGNGCPCEDTRCVTMREIDEARFRPAA